jgi:uncharacterized membrane-anchored protein
VQEGRAEAIWQAIRDHRPVVAEVAVAANGAARVRALIVDGVRQ